ncbi:MAG: EpsD family peptidyl-prolyl cis-trans isomerase [Aquabacterium sp.]
MLFVLRSSAMRSTAYAVCGLTLLGSVSGCTKTGSSDSSTSQVVATVNSKEISIHQVQTVLELQPKLAHQFGEQSSERVLDSLIEQELAAQAAKAAGLDQTPKVVQALALSQREVLARAYQDQVASKVTMPDDADVEEYYKQHPELFVKRRLYGLQEAVVRAESAELAALRSQVESAGSVSAINGVLQKAAVKYSARQSSQWAEALPMELLGKLASKSVGQSVWIDRPDGAVILTIVSAEESPLTLNQAKPAIREVLWSLRRKQAIQKGMNALREQAKITRQPVGGSASAPAQEAR